MAAENRVAALVWECTSGAHFGEVIAVPAGEACPKCGRTLEPPTTSGQHYPHDDDDRWDAVDPDPDDPADYVAAATCSCGEGEACSSPACRGPYYDVVDWSRRARA